MDCCRFRHHHASFVDDALPGVLSDELAAHRAACTPCATHDTRVRRSLMVARSLAPLQPSQQFRRALAERLAAERVRPASVPSTGRGVRIAAAATAACLAIAAGALVVAPRAAPEPAVATARGAPSEAPSAPRRFALPRASESASETKVAMDMEPITNEVSEPPASMAYTSAEATR
jgi:hypothetical protein